MICDPCRWEAEVRVRVHEGKKSSLPRRNVLFRKGHAICQGCDCQHDTRVRQFINQTLVKIT